MKKLIKTARVTSGFTQAELAKKLGYRTPQFISNLERGLANVPPGEITKYSKLLGIKRERLVKAYIAKCMEYVR